MMHFLILFVVVLFGIASADEMYTTKFDNIDFNEILNSERLLKNYVNCLMDRGSCTPDGAELKRVLPEALQTECAKCSETQKNGVRKVIAHLYKSKKDIWEELQSKYDPDGTYVKKFEEELKKEGLI